MNLTESLKAFAGTYGGGVFMTASAWILSTLLFAALIIYISKHPQKRTMPLKMAFIIMFVGGTSCIVCVIIGESCRL